MKIWLLIIGSILVVNGSDLETLPDQLQLGVRDGRIFVTTNITSSAFYLIGTNLNLSAMVGTKYERSIINESRLNMTTQYVPTAEMVNGRGAPGPGYILIYGRYGALAEQVLTLTNFQMEISEREASRNEIVSVRFESVSFKVTKDFLNQIRELKETNEQPTERSGTQ